MKLSPGQAENGLQLVNIWKMSCTVSTFKVEISKIPAPGTGAISADNRICHGCNLSCTNGKLKYVKRAFTRQ